MTRDEIAQLIEENIEVTVSLERSVGVDGTKAADAILARLAATGLPLVQATVERGASS